MFGDGNLRSDGCSKGEERRDETESVSSEAEGGRGPRVVVTSWASKCKCKVQSKSVNARGSPEANECETTGA